MRLWHSKLIPLLDGRRLCDLHMSCCNLRGLGWGKRNKNIDYIYDDPLGEEALAVYHTHVLQEMACRDYNFEHNWLEYNYCGKRRQARQVDTQKLQEAIWRNIPLKAHNLTFYKQDIVTLQERGVVIMLERRHDKDMYGPYITYHAVNDHGETFYGIRI